MQQAVSFSIKLFNENAFEENLKNLGYTDYTPIKKVKATPGKSIVILSLKSLEAGFIKNREPYIKLTPNFQELKKEYSFSLMKQVPGAVIPWGLFIP